MDERERSSAVRPWLRNNVTQRHFQVSLHLFTANDQGVFDRISLNMFYVRRGRFKITHQPLLLRLYVETSDASLLSHCSALAEWETQLHSICNQFFSRCAVRRQTTSLLNYPLYSNCI